VMAILAGKFDRKHARNIGGYLAGAKRVLELGGGIGFCAMKALRDAPGLVVMVQDEGPGMSKAAAEVARRNGFEDTSILKLVGGKLAVAGGLDAYLRDFRPDALRVNARAGVTPGALGTAPLESVRRIILPFETAAERDEVREGFTEALASVGFEENAKAAEGGSLLFLRG
jgi:hypothetical protein